MSIKGFNLLSSSGSGKKVQLSAVLSKQEDDDIFETKEIVEKVINVDASGVHTSEDSHRKTPLVIPLIRENQWRDSAGSIISSNASCVISASTANNTATTTTSAITATVTTTAANGMMTSTGSSQTILSEEEEAIASLKAEANDQVLAPVALKIVPLLARNQPPGLNELPTENERFRRDVNMRPEQPSLSDYTNMPVENFGAALLRGMGWKEVQDDNRTSSLRELMPRHHRLGLGATPKPPMDDEDKPARIPKPGDPVLKRPLLATNSSHKSPTEFSSTTAANFEGTSNLFRTWLKPNLRVRIVSDKFKSGKFYNQKVIVEDVNLPSSQDASPRKRNRTDDDAHRYDKVICSARTEEGLFLQGKKKKFFFFFFFYV